MLFSNQILLAVVSTLLANVIAMPLPAVHGVQVSNRTELTIEQTMSYQPVDFTTMVHKRSSSDDGTNVGYIQVPLFQSGNYFLAEAKVGSHGRKMPLILDTDSGDVVIRSSTSFIPKLTKFNTKYSKSLVKVPGKFDTKLTKDELSATGSWGYDTFQIMDNNGTFHLVDSTMLALATESDLEYSVLGMGPQSSESSQSLGASSFSYTNLLNIMKSNSLIEKSSYSIFLESKSDTSGGEMIIGGIDKTKFAGDSLTYLPLTHRSGLGEYGSSMYFDLDGIRFNNTQLTGQKYPAKITSANKRIAVPKAVFENIGNKYGTYDPFYDSYVIACDATGPDFEFIFGGNTTITVPFNNVVINATPLVTNKNYETCVFGLEQSTSDYFELGSAFLQSAYVHFQMDNNEIGVAQSQFNQQQHTDIVIQ
ncbi:hypothetical protein DASC09_005450 [Saccharomycopsis crataegensis]|uniref:Peptidase A1 domain-containing protein n=1 Tax=Saccharomycopsis crataegensis TaxID=43959 RepID=A0AAV5QE44_9ASCO|nr:hypothetical protein DASC09_005450 [Saccharomycopsis crataegensis]